MQIGQIISKSGAVEAAPQEARSNPAAASLSENRIQMAKEIFWEEAKRCCPGFQVTEQLRPVLRNIVLWLIGEDGPLDPAKGLWLWGNNGTGKSTLLEIVKSAGAILRPMDSRGYPYGFRTINATQICAAYQNGGYEALEPWVNSSRLAIDELGAETIPTGYYGTTENVIQYIMQRRYDRRRGAFTHVTTNLECPLDVNRSQIASVYGPRVYDRCKEMFNFIEMRGQSFRKN